MRKVQGGGATYEKWSIFTIAYADSIVLMADNEKGLEEMIKNS